MKIWLVWTIIGGVVVILAALAAIFTFVMPSSKITPTPTRIVFGAPTSPVEATMPGQTVIQTPISGSLILRISKDDNDTTFQAGQEVEAFILVENKSQSEKKFYGVDTQFTFDSAKISLSLDKNFIPSLSGGAEWTWSSDTGSAGGTLIVTGATNGSVSLPAGSSKEIAKIKIKVLADTTVAIVKSKTRIIEVGTNNNILDAGKQIDEQLFSL